MTPAAPAITREDAAEMLAASDAVRSPNRWAMGLVLGITALVMVPVCLNQFVLWDDDYTVACNAAMAPMTWQSVRYWWSGPTWELYCPVTNTVWGLLSLIGHVPTDPATGISQRPLVFHAGNYAVHLLATWAVFHILRILFERPWPAAAGALLFGVHPLQVETVACVGALNGGLCSMLGLMAIWQYLRFARGRSGMGTYALATVLLALAVLAKPLGVVVPLIAATLDGILLGRSWRDVAKSLALWFGIAMVGVAIAILAQPGKAFETPYPWIDRPFVAVDTMMFYVRKLLVPSGLAVAYRRSPNAVIQSNASYYLWLLPVTAAALLWKWRPKGLIAGAAVYVIGIGPTLGLVRFAYQIRASVADRYCYLAMLGFSIAVTWAMSRPWCAAKHRAARVAWGWAAVIAIFSVLTVRQIRTWHDSQSMFRQAGIVLSERDAPWPGHLVWPPKWGSGEKRWNAPPWKR